MKDFLSNVWVKRAVSVFNVAYFAVITLLTYATFLYDLEFAAGREKSFFTVYVVINVVFMGLMLFSRRELVTEILSILMLPDHTLCHAFQGHAYIPQAVHEWWQSPADRSKKVSSCIHGPR